MEASREDASKMSTPSAAKRHRALKKRRKALWKWSHRGSTSINDFRFPDTFRYPGQHEMDEDKENDSLSERTDVRAFAAVGNAGRCNVGDQSYCEIEGNNKYKLSTLETQNKSTSDIGPVGLVNQGPKRNMARDMDDVEDEENGSPCEKTSVWAFEAVGNAGSSYVDDVSNCEIETHDGNEFSPVNAENESTSGTSLDFSDDCDDTGSSDDSDDTGSNGTAGTSMSVECDNVPTGMFAILGNHNSLTQSVTMRPHITESDILCQVIAISIRHRLTYEATLEILKMIISITNGSGLPSTKTSLWATLLRNDNLVMVRHMYCRLCHCHVGEGTEPSKECTCGACGPNKPTNCLSYFIQLSLEEQLKNFFAIPGIVDILRYRERRRKMSPTGIEDIFDGKEYKKECEPGGFFSSEYNYSFTINTDGCKVANSSNASAWPILLTINELPPHARKRYMLLAGIWVDNNHPNLNMFLLPSIKELGSLYKKGVTWKPEGAEKVTSKFITLVCSVDSIARPALLNMTQFNGEYGCTFCYAKGKGTGATRTYPLKENASLRTDNQIRKHMTEAREKDGKVLGVKGTSVLKALPKIDLSKGIIVESMHNVFLGAVKRHTSLLLFGKATDPWYRGTPKNMAIINFRLKSARLPVRISRKPRDVQDYKNWKASEWRNWLFYYGTVCLKGIIRECDLENFTLLSRAIYILNKDTIGTQDLYEARELLQSYVKGFENIFGEENMTFNIHLLTHLADTVENWGPLWATSAFPFESFNKRIIDSVTSAIARPLQIVTRFLMNRFIESQIYDESIPQHTKMRIEAILKRGRNARPRQLLHAPSITDSNFRVLGRTISRQPSPWELESLNGTGNTPFVMSVTQRAIIRGVEYSCRKIKENTNHCNKFVFVRNIGLAEILYIVQFDSNGEMVCGLFIQCFDDLGSTSEAQHIRRVAASTRRAFVTIDDVQGPAVIISNHSGTYGIKLPNVWETD